MQLMFSSGSWILFEEELQTDTTTIMFNKMIILAVLAAVALAQYGHNHGAGYGAHGYGGPGYGPGYADHYDYSHPQPYDYGYNVKDDYGNQQFRKESGDGKGSVKGSYGYVDAHGIHRQVDYVADHHGFRAQVKTNEPGTANQNPAAVGVHSDAPQYVAPVASHHHGGPYHAAPSYALPYSHPRPHYGHY